MDTKLLGQIIRDIRKRKGYTQERLAKESGISVMSVRRYEAGERTITDELLSKIVHTLNLPNDYFESVYRVRSKNQIPPFDDGIIDIMLERFSGQEPTAKNITFNAKPDAEWVELEKKLAAGTITTEELQRYKALWSQGLKNAHKAVSEAKAKLSVYMDMLNDEGKQKAVERVAELTEIPKYGKHWGREIADKITCPMSQINEYTAKGYEVSSIQFFENGTGEGTATMVKVTPSDASQSSGTIASENPPESAPEDAENK